MIRSKLAAQMHTLRNEARQDFEGVLRDVSKMGWTAVQIDGLHGNPAKDIAAILKETGLKVAGMHVGLERMKNDLPAVLEEADLFDTRDFICHSLPDGLQTPEGYVSVKKDLLAVAAKVKGTKYRAGYHNHDFEFHTRIGDQFALEYLLDDPAIYAEIDTYWVLKGGQDPLGFISNYANRMPILHLKDMTSDGREYFAEIGTGLINFAPILQWGLDHGVEWFAVEQDYCPGSPLDSLALSLDNLLKLEKQLKA
ncbi:sugar phosphate isomerase/epimerase [Paenibacillus pasadenensis]|uniref:sugar phosphate isomerase/epimerase family protein n=1 Tax=Paenibacillus pasadenensis TaxID=217090 RepID=UPI002041DEF0|nr:sugar phosphate isomerase/epimerase [Paenibacillus pasadenensis]MCM3749802.1 sugar phosphate isomerase/epimerase [Paenibacillus pasadenensis]